MRLSDFGESRLIKLIRSFSGHGAGDVVLGIGDDAAVVHNRGPFTLLTSDMMIEGVHFDLSYITFFQLGYKILAVNISDILAMGGKPKFFMLDIAVPSSFDSRNIRNIYRGMKKLADIYGVAVVGGDTCSSGHDLLLSATLTGEAARPIQRKGAQPGDGIYVTGTLGDASLGLLLLKSIDSIAIAKQRRQINISGSTLSYRSVSPLLRQFLTPQPIPLKRTHRITSMIDVSDGLFTDLGHICDESGVGAEIHSSKLPLSRTLINTCRTLGKDPIDFATRGGEDYRLLFTDPSYSRRDAVRIGSIRRKGRYIIYPDRRRIAFKDGGYEHFR